MLSGGCSRLPFTDVGEIMLMHGFISYNENPSAEQNERSAGNLPTTN